MLCSLCNPNNPDSIINDAVCNAEFKLTDIRLLHMANSLLTSSRAPAREPLIFPHGTFILKAALHPAKTLPLYPA